MKKKILSFVVCNGKFLVLRNNPQPGHGGDFWFTVTGYINKEETHEDAVKREVKEETDLNVLETFPLNWGSIYNWKKDTCEELNFISFVNQEEINLSEEHTEFEWLPLDKFIERIKWDDDKKILREVLEKALNKELYFKKKEMKDYR